jgi:hypothetical protein
VWKTSQLHIKFQLDNVGKISTCEIPIHHVPYTIDRAKLVALLVEFCHARGVLRKNDNSINICRSVPINSLVVFRNIDST